MFESLSDKLKRSLKNLRGQGKLTPEHVDLALKEIRMALLEADVNYKVAKDFVEDSTGRKIIRDDTLSFRTKNTSDYGSLKLRFLNLDLSRHPVLQFVQGGQLKYSHVFTDRTVNIKLFQPGEYDLRILYDENGNGKWDPGEFFEKHKQPEKVQPLQRKLEVKPNWDSEVDITI